MTTKKKSYASRLGILALVLALTSTCLLGGTMAKYATEVTGTGSATVAKWSFKVNGETATMATVDLANTNYSNVKSKTIAPGTKGSFDIELDASGSEVAVDYTIAFKNLSGKPDGLKFYSDAARKTEISLSTGLTGTIALSDVNTKLTKTIYWEWPYGADNTDIAQTGSTMKFDIAVTGAQQTPATS